MKTMHQKILQKYGVIALAITVFQFPSIANAASGLLPKEGVSLKELKQIVPDLEIIQEGRNIQLEGSLPARCAAGAKILSPEYENAKHLITIRLAKGCEVGFQAVENEEKLALSSVLKSVTLKDESGPVHVLHFSEGGPKSKTRRHDDEALLVDKKGKAIKIMSTTEIVQQEIKARMSTINADVATLCKKEDFIGLGEIIESNRDLLGDLVDQLLERVKSFDQEKYLSKLLKAKDGKTAAEILEKYKDAAVEKGWDEDFLNKDYVAKRFAILKEKTNFLSQPLDKKEKAVAAKDLEKEVEAWKVEVRINHSSEYSSNKGVFIDAYGELAVAEDRAGNHERALMFLDKGMRLSPEKQYGVWLDAMKKVGEKMQASNVKSYEACLDKAGKSPANMKDLTGKKFLKEVSVCEADFKDRGERQLEAAQGVFSGRDENGEEAFAEFMAQHGQLHVGQGPVMLTPYGSIHPYAPSTAEQMKMGALQNFQQTMLQQAQQQQQMMYQKAMMGGGGMGMNPLYR